MHQLPSSPEWLLARQLTTNHDAWIVGSAALPDADPLQVKDVDILVPWDRWHAVAALLVHLEPTPNAFGGWRVKTAYTPRVLVYDVWPGDLTFLARNSRFKAAWHPGAGTRLLVSR